MGGIVLTLRYRWLLDDAFVYFRYIDNFLFLDLGLVYNQGEYVEGFSSPGWMLMLLGLRALHLDWWFMVQGVGCVIFALFWWVLVRLNRELSPGRSLLNLPLLYLAANYAVNTYFTSGVETPAIQLVGVIFAFYILEPRSRTRQLLVGVSPLVRPELALPLILVILWTWARRRFFPRWILVSTALTAGLWEVFRMGYYADPFPNTFYLKSTLMTEQGLVYLQETLTTYHFYVMAPLVLLLLVGLRLRSSRAAELKLEERFVMVALAAVITAYVVSIGGDPRHYRYLAFPFCLAACAFGGVPEWLALRLTPGLRWAGLPVGISLFLLFARAYPAQLDKHPFTHEENHRRVAGINDAAAHRAMPPLQHEYWSKTANIDAMVAWRESGVGYSVAEADTKWWCVDMYMKFDRRMVNSLGLTDPFLARTPMPSYRPAHKWGLLPLAVDMIDMYRKGDPIGRGMFRRYVESGEAPEWMVLNLEELEKIALKAYNQHDLVENFRLAFTKPGPIVAEQREGRPSDWEDRPDMRNR